MITPILRFGCGAVFNVCLSDIVGYPSECRERIDFWRTVTLDASSMPSIPRIASAAASLFLPWLVRHPSMKGISSSIAAYGDD